MAPGRSFRVVTNAVTTAPGQEPQFHTLCLFFAPRMDYTVPIAGQPIGQ